MRRILWLILALVLLPLGAQAAAQLETLYLSPAAIDEGEEMPADAVAWYKGSDGYYLLMPGGTDWEETRVWFQGKAQSLEIDGAEYQNGEYITGLSDGSVLQVKAGKKTLKVHVMQGSSIGALFISTATGTMTKVDRSKYYKETGALRLLGADGTYLYDGNLDYVKLRGNTSSVLPKKNYSIKLEKGTNLYGMGKAKRWVLQGSYRDKTQIRNQIVYSMADYVGLRYTPQVVQVDVYFNHEYNGTYLLTEKIEVGKSRVNISDLEAANKAVNDQPLDSYPTIGYKSAKKGKYKAYDLPNDPEDITGGYIIEYENMTDRYKSESCAYRTTRGKVLLVKTPEVVSEAEMEYISGFMQGYENAIFAENGKDPNTGKRYDEFVDFDSLVLKYMLEEVCMNCDGNASSQYYVKPSDDESTVAFAGPAWDYDTTFGDFAAATRTFLLNPRKIIHGKVSGGNYWWPQLYKRDEFQQGIRQAWAAEYSQAMRILMGEEQDPMGRLCSVDEYAAAIEKSNAMNVIRWPIPKRTATSVNQANTGTTIAANLTYLKDFIAKRYDYLNGVWGAGK